MKKHFYRTKRLILASVFWSVLYIGCAGRPAIDEVPPECGSKFPRDCTIDQCVRGYGCLVDGLSKEDIRFLYVNREYIDDNGTLHLVAASGRVDTPDEVLNNEGRGLYWIASLLLIQRLSGNEVFKNTFGALATEGFSDTGAGRFGKVAGVVQNLIQGKIRHFLIPRVATFIVYAPGKVKVYQGYGEVTISPQGFKQFHDSVVSALAPDNPEIQKLKPDMRNTVNELFEGIRSQKMGGQTF